MQGRLFPVWASVVRVCNYVHSFMNVQLSKSQTVSNYETKHIYLDDFLFLTPRLGKSGGSIRSKSPTFIELVLNWFWCFVNDDCADGSALFLETLVGFNCSWYQLGSFWCFPDVALMTIIGSSHHSDAPYYPLVPLPIKSTFWLIFFSAELCLCLILSVGKD